MNKKHVNVISIVFIAIGVLSASLILYDFLTNSGDKPELIDKNKAEKIAISDGDWNQNTLKDKSVTSKLLHIKNDGFAFLVDQDSLEDKEIFMTKFSKLNSNQYVWMVIIHNENNREWYYLIDAKNSSVIESTNESLNEFESINPYESIENDSFITQARGDVTIKFTKGITEFKSSPFPAKLVITVGDTITWENYDDVAHNVASTSYEEINDVGRVFESGIVESEKSFSFTFDQNHLGQIDYTCLLHPWEVGSVVVQQNN